MSSTPFFSILTPVKNGVPFIYSYLNSLFSQKFTDWECIVIDDLSSDDSFQLLKSLTLTDSRFRIFINSNISTINSPASARNCAISHAKGRYCCFLDIDDCWSSSHLQNYFDVLTSQPHISLVYADTIVFQSNQINW